MFITDKLVYIQLQKTGCTHIAKLLDQTVGGKRRGKHNPATQDLLDSSRLFVSSIRNPWEWYVSLWSFGCDGRGGFRKKVTIRKRVTIRKLWMLHPSQNPISLGRLMYRELTKATRLWKHCYTDSSDPKLFREWLKMVYDPRFRFDFGEGYGESTVDKLAGIYTYRYLKLCCRNTQMLNSGKLEYIEDLLLFEENNCYISKWIRNELLERDFMDIVISSGEEITQEDEQLVLSGNRTNVSSRSQPTSFYYDDETAELVREKEALIIKKFGYSFPGADKSVC